MARTRRGHTIQRCPYCHLDFARLDRHLAGRGKCGQAARAARAGHLAAAPTPPPTDELAARLRAQRERVRAIDPADVGQPDWWRPEEEKPNGA